MIGDAAATEGGHVRAGGQCRLGSGTLHGGGQDARKRRVAGRCREESRERWVVRLSWRRLVVPRAARG